METFLLPWLTIKHDNYNLKICNAAPFGASNIDQICATVFDSSNGTQTDWVPPPGFRRDATSSLDLPQIVSTAVTIGNGSQTITLSDQCTRTLLYPAQRLRNSMDEDLALIFIQFWLLVISSSAIISQSMSHILAVFSMRVLATGWSAYTIWRTNDLDSRLYHLLVAPNTPCHTDFDFFPSYFQARIAFQIPDLVLNICALLFTAALGWRLIKYFNVNTFNCVGPPAHVVHLYRYMLTVQVSTQLLLYFIITSISLALIEGIISKANLLALDVVLFVLSVISTVALVILGYYSIRYEKRRSMIAFLVLLGVFLIGFAMMFVLPAFRFTWIEWPFFACVSGICAAALACCTVFAILCRVHFGEGLSHYLHVEKVLADHDFEPDDFSADDTSKMRNSNRMSNVVGDATQGTTVLKRDTNWDFIDIERSQSRPPIYTIDVLVDDYKG